MPFIHDRNRRGPVPPAVTTEPAATSRAQPLAGQPYAAQQAALSPNAAQPARTEAKPAKPFGQVAAGIAKGMDAEQSRLIDERGYGAYTGIKSGETSREGTSLKKTDCTTYVIDTLRAAFAETGRGADWDKVFSDAQKNSGAGGFRGTELMKSLQSVLGWVGAFWAPDSKSSNAEHSYSAAKARSKGSYYGISVDKDKLVTDYAPENASRTADTSGIEKLKRIAFGVLAAKGGMHMAMILGGVVYEVHWSNEADSHELFEAKDLKDWGWGSGAIVMPPDEAAKWNQPGPLPAAG